MPAYFTQNILIFQRYLKLFVSLQCLFLLLCLLVKACVVEKASSFDNDKELKGQYLWVKGEKANNSEAPQLLYNYCHASPQSALRRQAVKMSEETAHSCFAATHKQGMPGTTLRAKTTLGEFFGPHHLRQMPLRYISARS